MARIGSGSYDLNKFLHGGYETDIVTVLYGGPGSGKTNFATVAAVSQAKKGKKVVFIDSEGGFSSDRVKQILGEKDGLKETMENILLMKPTSFSEQKKAFLELGKHLRKGIGLIIVDSITILYRLEFANAREKGDEEIQKINSELVRQIKTLAEIARKQSIPVLVTTQVYRWEEAQQIVGGDILKYWAKCLIELENDKGRRVAHLRKHRSLPEKSLVFQIWDGGIRRRGWL